MLGKIAPDLLAAEAAGSPGGMDNGIRLHAESPDLRRGLLLQRQQATAQGVAHTSPAPHAPPPPGYPRP